MLPKLVTVIVFRAMLLAADTRPYASVVITGSCVVPPHCTAPGPLEGSATVKLGAVPPIVKLPVPVLVVGLW